MMLYARPLAASLKAALHDTPVVCVLGPRQSGKTTLARGLGSRYTYVSFDDAAALAFARADPAGFVAALPRSPAVAVPGVAVRGAERRLADAQHAGALQRDAVGQSGLQGGAERQCGAGEVEHRRRRQAAAPNSRGVVSFRPRPRPLIARG